MNTIEERAREDETSFEAFLRKNTERMQPGLKQMFLQGAEYAILGILEDASNFIKYSEPASKQDLFNHIQKLYTVKWGNLYK